jgi:hypothetical protein
MNIITRDEFSPEAKAELDKLQKDFDVIQSALKEPKAKQSLIENKMWIIQNKERSRIEQERRKGKKNKQGKANGEYMNLVFYWDNGMKFDTRGAKALLPPYITNGKIGNWIEFKDMVFAYGLPTKYEVRG